MVLRNYCRIQFHSVVSPSLKIGTHCPSINIYKQSCVPTPRRGVGYSHSPKDCGTLDSFAVLVASNPAKNLKIHNRRLCDFRQLNYEEPSKAWFNTVQKINPAKLGCWAGEIFPLRLRRGKFPQPIGGKNGNPNHRQRSCPRYNQLR